MARKSKGSLGVRYSEERKKEIAEKRHQRMIEKYGENYKQIMAERRRQTMLKKYGVDNPSKLDKVKEKKKQTLLKNYGVTTPLKSSLIKEKFKKTINKTKKEKKSNQLFPTKPPKINIPFKFVRCIFCGRIVTVNKKFSSYVSCDWCLEKGLRYRLSKENLEKRKKKQKETCLKKYGVESHLQLDSTKEKRKQTILEKYGVDNVFKSEKIKEKIKQTNLKRYGVENISQNNDIRCLLKNKYMTEKLSSYLNKFNLELLSEYNGSQNISTFKCKLCGCVFNDTFFKIWQRERKCPECSILIDSSHEKEILDFLTSIGIKKIITNDRHILHPFELDIFIPDKNIAIEFDGLYWHSEEQGKDKNYHLMKTERCLKQGIQLIHIFEDEWLFKQDIVKARLKQILGVNNVKRIHARKCEIKEIDSKTKNEFLEKYHIQGKDNSKIRLGAFYNDELISVMTFSHGNISKGSKLIDGVWELNRFCSNPNYHIPGIASKLLKFFQRNYNWKEIFSYADRRWSIGNIYEKLGFWLDSISRPNYWYFKDTKRIHRFNLRKRPDEPKEISEWQLRQQQGYYRIWDCGNLKYILRTK